MLKALIPFIAVVLSVQAAGQQAPLSGSVQGPDGPALPFANVAVLSPADSAIVTGGTSDLEGRFQIPVVPGSYVLKASYLGMRDRVMAVAVPAGGLDVGILVLEQSGIRMQEVEVVGQQRQMELKLDKRVFNVEQDMSVRGGTAADVLDNVPSVSVDVEGNVSLRGSQNVRILIDGKPSGLVGISSTDALRTLQGDLIDKVEVITNPSARYDAEGEAGIINIVLKKEKRGGLNGSFEATTGYPDNHGLSFSLNRRSRKVNLFSSYGFAFRRSPGQGSSFQRSTGDTAFVYERERENTRGGRSHNLQLGADLFLDPRHTVTLSGLYRDALGNNDALLIYRDLDADGDITRTTNRSENEEETDLTRELALGYKWTFPQKDRQFTVDLKWMDNDDEEVADLTEVSDPGGVLEQRSSNTENEQNILLQWDYVHPFRTDGRFEAGMRSTLRTIENDYLVEVRDPDGDWEVLEGFDDFFLYTENIHAAYLMAGDRSGRLSYQAGLRAELSDITTELRGSGQVNARDYLDLFPSAHLSHELDSLNTLQLSYSRRLNRPRFRHLLPFYTFSDNRVFFGGNPDLDPEYTNSFELGHMHYHRGGSILSSIYYRHGTGVIERITQLDSLGLTRIFPVNLSVRHAFGLELNANHDLKDWWRLSGNVNFFREITEGRYQDQDLYSDTYRLTAWGSMRFTIRKAWDLQANVNYQGPRQTTQGRQLSMTSVDLALARDLLRGKATVTLSVRDLFNSRKFRSVVDLDDFYSESEFQWRLRQFLLTVNYRLHRNKSRGERGMGGGDGGGDMGF